MGTPVLIVLLVVLVVSGGPQVPKLARSIGKAKTEFEQGLNEGDQRVQQSGK